MNDKCSKYEALFTFGSDEDLQKHITECEDCRLEHEKMQKISSLVQEVKPYYKRKRQNTKFVKVACTLLFLCISSLSLGIIGLNPDISDTIQYGTTLSAEDLGFPVDAYGLIMVE